MGHIRRKKRASSWVGEVMSLAAKKTSETARPTGPRVQHSPSRRIILTGREKRVTRIYDEEQEKPAWRPSVRAVVLVDAMILQYSRWGRRVCYAYVNTLAERTGFSRRTVQNCVRWLELHGLVERRQTGRYPLLKPILRREPAPVEETPEPEEPAQETCRTCAPKEASEGVPTGHPSSDGTEGRRCSDNQPPTATSTADCVSGSSDPGDSPSGQPLEVPSPTPDTDTKARFLGALSEIGTCDATREHLRRTGHFDLDGRTLTITTPSAWLVDALRRSLFRCDERGEALQLAAELAFGMGVRVRCGAGRGNLVANANAGARKYVPE